MLTEEAFESMIARCERFEDGVNEVISENDLGWHAVRIGCRIEYKFRPDPPRNGSEAVAAEDHDLDRFMHLHALNRGVLMTPFHSMALMSPATTDDDVDRHTGAFAEAVRDLIG